MSVVVVFFNMRREAIRTLFSLTTAYQRDISIDDYDVIVLDSGSTQALDGPLRGEIGIARDGGSSAEEVSASSRRISQVAARSSAFGLPREMHFG